ncbi:hypothetical protein RRV45_01175 [Bacillus sp. DTU_2020_1000418_1_SI_GHA_SEK_038]|uniref:hypothetical protein n=1 Tax=Bacillus sp. DTU_2020_1000418_1_SI_GHA_SEK_038 TaxID=3077585 RepID=UPI0028E21603|nr:hypothetical protein [Bacillus sp. DTU_2020_1000418_1_SI_GHA_SEK_038]WNS75691.1 hypothetical protein RRV45_01175 [Bacillus sp. DTU_2020_1000418_1_SI_GHA_SEK_038]
MDFEVHLYRIIIGSFIEDLSSDYEFDDFSIINKFEEELELKESVNAAMEDFELEHLYQQIIDHCPSFRNPEYWVSLKTALNIYDKSIRPTEERYWED